ncbi:PREDICTED: adenylate isopentenyltransferase 5, chloroplastic-like [Nicotiana attenuata]|uniref:adenylate isopentenyltransferase 5, chloroplastic-like n=1 Tax=Nicotiana attenuata TaxID=49451 RepID=UPI000904B560|nr:PREDICTED: adenylate isopentenyltransferase 5, chloroplastic-like [Nicotiana attenuata]
MMLYVHGTESVLDETKLVEILGDLIDDSTYSDRNLLVLACSCWFPAAVLILVAAHFPVFRNLFSVLFNSAVIAPTQNKAIGVPEFDSYFRAELSNSVDVETRERILKEAINEVKINNCILASKQLEKIKRLINVKGWKIQRLDATEAFRRKQRNAEEEADEIWKNM